VIGTTLSHFKITAKLGEGGMGAVYLAEDLTLKREVALKVLPGALADDPERRLRFRREAEALAALNHPNIVSIYSVEEAGGVRFLIMERVAGHSLRELIPAEGLPIGTFFDWAGGIAGALATAHAKGIVHRDLKPANVMVADDGTVKVLDLGLAKLLEAPGAVHDDSATRTAGPTALGAVMGTYGYMSPEQAEGRPVGPPSDVFALGTLFYEMLSGINPFRRESAASCLSAILHHQPAPVSELRRGLPAGLQAILDRCLTKEAAARYPSATELRGELEACGERHRRRSSGPLAALRRPAVAVTVAALLAVIAALGAWLWRGASDRRWAREEALPEIERLVEASWRDFSAPYALAVEAERYIPGDSRLAELLARCSLEISLTTRPPGAEVWVKAYDKPQDEWTRLGTTPIASARVPITVLRWKLEKPGYETALAVEATWDVEVGAELLQPASVSRTLDRAGDVPAGMVRVAGAETPAGVLEDFYIDRYEVTNRRYQDFVDAGGYREPAYWRHEIVAGGRALGWREAMERFVDPTGRPGPANWQAGAYLEGQGDLPVGGISWYEAAAYAEWAGKALPTTFHWGLARGDATALVRYPQLGGFATLAPYANFGGRGPHAVGSLPGYTAFGAYDMAGNLREWCLNHGPSGRAVRGGAWSDATYMFEHTSQLPAMDRSPQNGFRCAYYPGSEPLPEAVLASIEPRDRFRARELAPVSDEIFEVFRQRFAYDRTDLEARVDSRSEDDPRWIHETVSFDAAYGGERMLAHLFLPRHTAPPYQAVVYFPGSGALMQTSSANIESYFELPVFSSFIVKSGRALVFPIYQGTFDRHDPTLYEMHMGDSSHRYTEYLVRWVRDFRRTVDYLESRADLDADRLAYYGLSWGALLGSFIPAIENRLRASVLLSGGLQDRVFGQDLAVRPEADPVNYLPRVRLPTLMLNGRYDMIIPFDQAIQPMFDLLGTPPEHKELRVFDTDHIPPRTEFIRATLEWLDRYLGPVGGESPAP